MQIIVTIVTNDTEGNWEGKRMEEKQKEQCEELIGEDGWHGVQGERKGRRQEEGERKEKRKWWEEAGGRDNSKHTVACFIPGLT